MVASVAAALVAAMSKLDRQFNWWIPIAKRAWADDACSAHFPAGTMLRFSAERPERLSIVTTFSIEHSLTLLPCVVVSCHPLPLVFSTGYPQQGYGQQPPQQGYYPPPPQQAYGGQPQQGYYGQPQPQPVYVQQPQAQKGGGGGGPGACCACCAGMLACCCLEDLCLDCIF